MLREISRSVAGVPDLHRFGHEAPAEPGTYGEDAAKRPAVLYRIRLTEKSGRFEQR